MEKPKCTYLKNVEKTTNKIRLPIKFVRTNGETYYMYVYEDYIVLKPIGGENGKSNN